MLLYTLFTLSLLASQEAIMSERREPLASLPDDDPVPQTPEEINDDDDDEEEDPLSDKETGPDPTRVI